MTAFDLDDKRKAILAAQGHLMIEGGPGCGKTTIALLKAAHALSAVEDQQQILFLSFSRAAVRQVTDRMRGTLTLAEQRALQIRTFHSFFLDVVRSHGRLLTGKPPRFLTPDREAHLHAEFAGTATEWQAERIRLAAEESVYIFDTLAPAVADLFENRTSVRGLYSQRYPVVVVDEFQDTNVDQWRVVQALSEKSTIICLADPDQRIFDHLDGIDDDRLDEAKKVLAPKVFDLSADNHRSPGSGILTFANGVLRNQPTERPEEVVVTSYKYEKPTELTHRLITQARSYLEREQQRPVSLAVLTRANTFASRISETIGAEETVLGEALPAIDHELFMDKELVTASAMVVASLLEWPTLARVDGVVRTIDTIADFYRTKVGLGTLTARKIVETMERAAAAISQGKNPVAKAAKLLWAASETPPDYAGRPVEDWQRARALLTGTGHLDEIRGKARLLRLLKATDSLAWALQESWDGSAGYSVAVEAVRQALTADALDGGRPNDALVHVMTLHKSKGKEYDGVIIVEDRHGMPLINNTGDAKQESSDRRLMRVGITRARHLVIVLRPPLVRPLID